MQEFKILIEGDSSVLIVFGDTISAETNQRIAATVRLIREQKIEGVVDMIPTYVSLLINYNPLVITYDALRVRLEQILRMEIRAEATRKRVFEIPVCYGGGWSGCTQTQSINAISKARKGVTIWISRKFESLSGFWRGLP